MLTLIFERARELRLEASCLVKDEIRIIFAVFMTKLHENVVQMACLKVLQEV